MLGPGTISAQSTVIKASCMRYQFSDLPEKWAALVKFAATIKYEIVPIQAHQIELISKRITFFNHLLKHFQQQFKNEPVRCVVHSKHDSAH